jgi:mRNA interferase RelE/StbE
MPETSGRDAWRIRVGDYRVLYEIDDPARTVLVVHIGHRRDVYR